MPSESKTPQLQVIEKEVQQVEQTAATPTDLRRQRRALYRETTNSPEFKQLQMIVKMGKLDSRYAALFSKLKLPPQELDRLKTLLAERDNVRNEVVSVARGEGLNIRQNREMLTKLVADNQAEIDTTIRDELGETTYDTYQQFSESERFWRISEQLTQKLSYSSSPLTFAQRDQLVQIMSQTSPASANRQTQSLRDQVALESGIDVRTPISAEVLNQARGVLTPTQFEVFQTMQNEQQAALKMHEIVRSVFENNANATIR